MSLTPCTPGIGPFVIADQLPSSQTLEVGDTVTLKSADLTVQARVLRADGSAYLGEVTGFSPATARPAGSLAISSNVEFQMEHVFGINKQ